MGWAVVGTAVFGVPRFLAKTLENKTFFHKKMQNRGAPKTAVPTTTHPIPQLTPSYSGGWWGVFSFWKMSEKGKGVGRVGG